MYIDQYTTYPIPDAALNQLQANIQRFVTPLESNQLLGGVLVSATLGVGDNVVTHKLGHSVTGWLITRMTGSAVAVYETASTEQTLTLNSTGIATVGLWVF